MRKTIMLVAAAAVIASGSALAHGPSGSYEGDSSHTYQNNNVRCRSGTAVSPLRTKVYASASRGAEVCKDGNGSLSQVPLQGRIIVSRSQGGYVAADGDRSNPSQAEGYMRVDRSGPHCSAGRDQDSTHSRTAGKPQTCDFR